MHSERHSSRGKSQPPALATAPHGRGCERVVVDVRVIAANLRQIMQRGIDDDALWAGHANIMSQFLARGPEPSRCARYRPASCISRD